LRQRGFDFVAEINVHAGGGVSFLFHAAESKTVKRGAGEKISPGNGEKLIRSNTSKSAVVAG
jgi:hypothetical protein